MKRQSASLRKEFAKKESNAQNLVFDKCQIPEVLEFGRVKLLLLAV